MKNNHTDRKIPLLRYCYLMNYCKVKKYRNFESVLYYTENFLNSLQKKRSIADKILVSFKTTQGFQMLLVRRVIKYILPKLTQKQQETFLKLIEDVAYQKNRRDMIKYLELIKNTV